MSKPRRCYYFYPDSNKHCECRKFKNTNRNEETCKVCDHDESWHEQVLPRKIIRHFFLLILVTLS
jgi:hypothetical protein